MPGERKFKLRRLDETRWEIPMVGGMRVPGLIFSDSSLLPDIEKDNSCEQVYNVAHMPGIVSNSIALPCVPASTVAS